MAASHVLVVRASFHGEVVEERFVRTGRPLEIGADPQLPVPVPEGAEYVARVLWTSRRTCAVKDAAGAIHTLEAGQHLTLQAGSAPANVQLELYLVEPAWLPRLGAVSIGGSLAWFAVVLMAGAVMVPASWAVDRRCELAAVFVANLTDVGEPLLWVLSPLVGAALAVGVLLLAEEPRRALVSLALPVVALLVPGAYHALGGTWKSGPEFIESELAECLPPPAGPAGQAMSAEYLARLLKRDLDGDQQGVIDRQVDRPKAERDTPEHNIFMPAGSAGPVTRMGGAEQVAPTPIRTIVDDAISAKAHDRPEQTPVTADAGRPVPRDESPEEARKGEEEGLEQPTEDQGEVVEAPAEEHEGWGFPEWYDERDRAMDDLEISLMLRAAQRRLAIDPDDAAALSILSYYQYLAQDYEAAKRTYDRYIELFPDDAAGYNNKALVYKRLKEYQKEESLYRVALSLEPDDETALNNLAVNLAHQGRHEEALAVMKQLESIDPEDPYADLHRSKIYAEMGKDDQSLTYLEKALEGMNRLDTLHHIEFRQDIRLDPSFERLRETYRFRAILNKYYGKNSPLEE